MIEVRKQVEEIINLELLKRGFPNICLEELSYDYETKKQKLVVSSEPFQTTPVIFKEIRIQNFGGRITELEINGKQLLEIVIPINVRYDHFDSGSNSCELFTITLRVLPNDDVRFMGVK